METRYENQMLAIDPMATILHGKALDLWYLIHHPHVPSVGEVKKALSSLSDDEKKEIINRAKLLGEYVSVVEEALKH